MFMKDRASQVLVYRSAIVLRLLDHPIVGAGIPLDIVAAIVARSSWIAWFWVEKKVDDRRYGCFFAILCTRQRLRASVVAATPLTAT